MVISIEKKCFFWHPHVSEPFLFAAFSFVVVATWAFARSWHCFRFVHGLGCIPRPIFSAGDTCSRPVFSAGDRLVSFARSSEVWWLLYSR